MPYIFGFLRFTETYVVVLKIVLAAIIGSLQSVHQTIPRAVLIAQLNMVRCFEHHLL